MSDSERIRILEEKLRELEAKNHALQQENETLRRALEEWKRGFRERPKRRPVARSASPEHARPVGRETGHPGAFRQVPVHVDLEQAHPMPHPCPFCGAGVEGTGEMASCVEVDIPAVQPVTTRHVTPVGRCRRCKLRVVAPLPGMSPSGTSVAKVVLGPQVQAMALSLRFEHHLPMGQIGMFLGRWVGVPVSAGGLAQLFHRLREQSASSYTQIEQKIHDSPVVGMDETGHRQNGKAGYLWVARTEQASLFRAELCRAGYVMDAMLGEDFKGVVVSDFYSVYTRSTPWPSSYCGAHLLREAKKIEELQPGALSSRFRQRLQDFYHEGKAAACRGDREAQRAVRRRLQRLASDPAYATVPGIARLQKRLRRNRVGITYFLTHPHVPCTNNATERDLRAYARHRAMTGGTRSELGSLSLAHWMSILQTCQKQGMALCTFLHQLWDHRLQLRSPPSLFSV